MRRVFCSFFVVFVLSQAAFAQPTGILEQRVLNGATPPPPPFSRCNDQHLFQCQYKFNQLLGIQGDADWRNPDILMAEISRRLIAGIDSMVQVCTAKQMYYKCLGPMYFSCQDPLYYLRHGYGTYASYTFLGVMNSLEWTCNGGFQIGVHNWGCITRTWEQSRDVIIGCITAFNTSASHDPSQFCTYGQTLAQCYSAPFAKTCSYNGESQWWACQHIQYHALMLGCGINCPIKLSEIVAHDAENVIQQIGVNALQ